MIDLINRENLLTRFHSIGFDTADDYDRAIAETVNAPPVDSTINAHWEWHESWCFNGEIKECETAGWRCSNCKCEPDEERFCFDNPDDAPEYRYCPHCGARMKRVQLSEKQKQLLDSLIDDLNSKSDDKLYEEFTNAGIIED